MRTDIRVPGEIARVCMNVDHELRSDYNGDYRMEVRTIAPAIRAKLATSLMRHREGWHAPVLDLDVPHEYVPSSTPGHAHLYLDVELPWWKYSILLRVLSWTGILEPRYVDASLARKHTSVRLPWIKKGDI